MAVTLTQMSIRAAAAGLVETEASSRAYMEDQKFYSKNDEINEQDVKSKRLKCFIEAMAFCKGTLYIWTHNLKICWVPHCFVLSQLNCF